MEYDLDLMHLLGWGESTWCWDMGEGEYIEVGRWSIFYRKSGDFELACFVIWKFEIFNKIFIISLVLK